MPQEFDEGDQMRRWKTNLAKPHPALKQIGAMMVAASQQAFREQKLGEKMWRPRSVPNAFGIIADFAAGKRTPPNRRFDKRPALTDTGRLRKSITFRVIGDTVSVGSNLDYAAIHMTGGEVESDKITKSVQRALASWLLKESTPESAVERMAKYLSPAWTNQRDTTTVPARPFVGLTRDLSEDIKAIIGARVFEV